MEIKGVKCRMLQLREQALPRTSSINEVNVFSCEINYWLYLPRSGATNSI